MINGGNGARQLIFDGNSLSEKGAGGAERLFRMTLSCIATLQAAGKVFSYENYAISGKQTSQLITDFPTKIAPYAHKGDIIFLWEITNDIGSGGLTGAQAYANIVTYSNLVRDLECKFGVMAMITRDYATDAANVWSEGQICNALIAANPQIYDAYARPDLDINFDQKSDASNLTYYLADKIHLQDAGSDLAASYASAALLTIL